MEAGPLFAKPHLHPLKTFRMKMNHIRCGSGKPLLLVHGLGGSWRSWTPVIDRLAAHREVIAIDLPGHGKTPPLEGPTTIATLADAVTQFLHNHQLTGIDAVGSSMGARLVLELARRGDVVGAVVSLDPGGFWEGWHRQFFYYSIAASIRLVRAIKPLIPFVASNAVTRTVLLPQFSARPWRLPAHLVRSELQQYVTSPVFDELLHNLAFGEEQKGAPRGSFSQPMVIGWGRRDRICFPSQSKKALRLFPDAHVYWFGKCGHFPHWDKPSETAALILRVTNGPKVAVVESGVAQG
jgi:pimeloyl-ACP methyl ester carboxylesterase